MKTLNLKIQNKIKSDEILVQGRVPTQLKEACEAKFEKDKAKGQKVNWKILMTAACESYLKGGK